MAPCLLLLVADAAPSAVGTASTKQRHKDVSPVSVC